MDTKGEREMWDRLRVVETELREFRSNQRDRDDEHWALIEEKLSDLNQVRDTFISREIYEQHHRELSLRMNSMTDLMNKRLGQLETWRASIAPWYLAIASMGGIIGGLIAHYLLKW